MAKDETETTTRKARKEATEKPTKETKTKRPPSAYNQYMKDNLPGYKKENPDKSHKEAFAAVAQQWADAPENPKRGQTAAEKENKPKKEKAPKKEPAAKKKKEAEATDEEAAEPGSDA
ncbi:hypothetical protein SISNIDRAFT_342097 [Sistotremastrum niveocremeum HHB9708]|uniref:HMG box domain-containing protein n=2 Tax=Sistotremastraceae TaxID=3402574 RepID=A0A164MN74_9AGAM|nr:hypothetical protein SISNIDRAFT_342097 [Sistotremastrum niveocremeum HHB9708]KZT38528.1 hypothetical protein SISSUDRAFT_729050 [Sistotremastrum suecicum HHB10207 ss-3]